VTKRKKGTKRKSPKNNQPGDIRTDKWKLYPSSTQKLWLTMTVQEYRKFVRALIGMGYTHWHEVADLNSQQQVNYVEALFNRTKQRSTVKYDYFEKAAKNFPSFRKFPDYLRRAAIQNAIGQVSSFVTRYQKWQSGIRNRRDEKPPRLTSVTNVYPALYKGQCIKYHEEYTAVEIKVWNGTDWVWTSMPCTVRARHLVTTNELKSPSLIVNNKSCHLSAPFAINPQELPESETVLAVDLGINTTATATVVTSVGTVKARVFIHPATDIDRRDKRLSKISRKASQTMRKSGKLHKGFCRGLYRKATNINREIAQKVSDELVKIASEHQCRAIVFENLKGWRPKGGRKRSNLKQRYHGWCQCAARMLRKRFIVRLTQEKWHERGGKVEFVNPRYTSKYAYDGSGIVKRDSDNYALCVFTTGKRYNADLNGSLNIAARYWVHQLGGCKATEVFEGKSSPDTSRTPITLATLWSLNSNYSSREDTTPTTRSV